ncbi:hypothetical protein B0H17DRAFT_1058795 [Mycena rosella]|uniref:MYND-type domain-containing protein n=1 Tax=Mycena rosella TaxID=1033263 RepID=A0AAD7DKQ3_MYCRO|nr:hypothetical protein B0H17DRAFT_1058795 [Mycena rosella]
MPLMPFYAGSNDRCYRCNEPGDSKLRKCARCQVALYCSPQCQKEDWKLHKPTCIDHKAILKNNGDPSVEVHLKVLLKWLDLWRDAILAWAAFSADLANQPADYLLTHSFFLELERRPPLDAAKHSTRSTFIALQGGMRTAGEMREQFERIPDLGYRGQVIETFKSTVPWVGKIRITLTKRHICSRIP